MIAELIVIVVIFTVMGYIFLKGTIVKSFVFFMNDLLAATVALSFFETAGRLVIGYGYGGQWIFAGVLVLIFALVFILLLAISDKLMPEDLHLGDMIDQVVRCVIAIPTGLVIAGVLIIAVNLSPLPEKWPYQRFAMDNKNTKPTEPDKTLFLNADGFVASFSSTLSSGSMSGKKSLATFHPDLLNELSLNRIVTEESNPIVAGTEAIAVSKAYEADPILAESEPIKKSRTAGTKTIIVQTDIRNTPVKDGGALYAIETGTVTLTMAQLRLICTDSADNLSGRGQVVYPVGWLINETTPDLKTMTEEIKLTGSDFPNGVKTLKLIYNIPSDKVPVMLQFKINAVAEINRLQTPEEETQQTPQS